jgi:hypothetical protein
VIRPDSIAEYPGRRWKERPADLHIKYFDSHQ